MSTPSFWTCPRCHAVVPAAPFCNRCGHSFAPAAAPRHRPHWLFTAIAVMLVVMLIPGALFLLSVPLARSSIKAPLAAPEAVIVWGSTNANSTWGIVRNVGNSPLFDVVVSGTLHERSNPSGFRVEEKARPITSDPVRKPVWVEKHYRLSNGHEWKSEVQDGWDYAIPPGGQLQIHIPAYYFALSGLKMLAKDGQTGRLREVRFTEELDSSINKAAGS